MYLYPPSLLLGVDGFDGGERLRQKELLRHHISHIVQMITRKSHLERLGSYSERSAHLAKHSNAISNQFLSVSEPGLGVWCSWESMKVGRGLSRGQGLEYMPT